MSKKSEWTSCGGAVLCTVCGSDEMMMLDKRIRSGVYERHTRCEGCGDRRTSKLEAPQLPTSAALEKLSQAIAEGPGDTATKTKLIGAIEAASAGDLATAGRLAAQAVEADMPRGSDYIMPQSRIAAQSWREDRPTVELLELDALHPDSIQPREQMDLVAIADYAAAMARGELGQIVDSHGEDWAPIVVYRDVFGKCWLADGFHRVRAAREAGHQAIQAQVFQGNKADALLYAVGANARNGVRITNADKRRAVGLLFAEPRLAESSDSEIARLCCVSQPFVSKLRAEHRQRLKASEDAERAREERDGEGSDNGYREERAPAPLQFDLVETIAQKQRRQAEEEEAAAERRAEAEEKRREQEQRDSWSTPPEFLDNIVRPILETIDLDPASNEGAQALVQAARWISAEEDGLGQEWEGNVWLNPPYSHPLIERFALKAIEEFKSGRVKQLLVLVNSSTSSVWWHELAKACAVVAFPLGRISFWSPHGLEGDANRSPSTLFYFAPPEQARAGLTHLRNAGYFATMHTHNIIATMHTHNINP